MFKKAVKYEEKLRLCLAGVAGSGKSYTALRVGCAIAEACGGRVAMADTENRSARKYADLFDFDTLDLEPPYHPKRVGEIVEAAAKAGYKVLIIDSMSHFWQGKGGLLEEVDKFAKKNSSGNSFAAWKDATPIQVAMVEAMLAAPLHLIVTVRSKMEFTMEEREGRGGRKTTVPVKVGLSPVQRSDLQYEFDVYGQLTQDNDLIVEKTRCSALAGEVINQPGEDLAKVLLDWTKGEEAPTQPSSAPASNGQTNGSNGNGALATDGQRAELLEIVTLPDVPERIATYISGAIGDDGLSEAKATMILERARKVMADLADDQIPF